MDNAKFWWSSSETPQPPVPPVDVIGQSLRFRGGSRLTRAGMSRPAGDYTLSLWVKCAWTNTSDNNSIFGNNTSVTGFKIGNPNGSGDSQLQCRDGASSNSFDTAARLKDPSAWYHFVFQTVGTNTTAFVNGVQHGNPVNTFGATGDAVIGSGNAANMDEAFHGYMADVYCIDGQTLEPTAFGRENNEGVWVPREVDFTPAQMRWSDFLTVSNGTIDNGPLGATAAFNGDLSDGDGRCFTSTGADLTWAPPADNPATFTTTLEIFNTNAPSQQNISWNGNTVNPTGGWVTVFTDPSPDPANPNVIDVSQPLVIDSIGSQRAELYAVRLDGEIVLNPFIWSAGLFSDNVHSADPADIDFNSTAQNWSSNTAATGFNGSDTDFVQTDGTWIFRPNPPIENATLVEVRQTNASNSQQLFFNSANVGRTDYVSQVWTEVYNGPATTINNIAGNFINPDGGNGFSGIRVNGQVLLDGVNNSYGANGFHLDFSDPDDLGADRSGSGNDFTATGFNTDPVGIFSAGGFTIANDGTDSPDLAAAATSTDTNWNPGNPPSGGFNGSDGAPAYLAEGGNAAGVRFNPPLENVTQIWCRQFNGQGNAINGVDQGNTSVSNTEDLIYDGPPITLETWVAWHRSANNGGWWILAVGQNGNPPVPLVDNTGADYDLMQDSPSHNWATLNPLIPFPNTNVIIQEGNLNSFDRNSTGSVVPSTIPLRGNTQFMWRVGSVFGQGPRIGVARANAIQNGGTWWQQNACFCQPNGDISNFDTSEPAWVTYAGGDVISVGYNQTANELTFTRNGGNTRVVTLTVTDDFVFFVMNMDNSSGGANFGQQPLLFPLENFGELQTQNLPAATIANGRDHFQAITDTGANILTAAQTAFPNGLWWIKDRVNSNQHQFVDSVTNASQGGGNWANTSPTISQAIAYAAPAGNSVAWCWNAAEPATSGFNIVQYTGQNPTTTTVPHGLPGIPDMIITQAKTGTTRNYAVFHSALGEGQWLQLNGSDQALADATMWANTAPDETNFFVGAANTTNFSGAVYTAYCWTAIPGHSAFGSFQGNSDTNGVFVYLGFRPQMLMIRTTGAGDSFFMLDSTRSPNNPIGVDGLLNAGSTDPEGTWSARDIDFLSNGFKLRSSSGSVNGGTVVYAAWAENPFGGSNVSPANAR